MTNWRVELRETGEMSLGPWPLLVFSAFVPLCLCHSAPSVSHRSTQMLSHKKAQDAQGISAHEKHECRRKGGIRYWLLEIETRSKVSDQRSETGRRTERCTRKYERSRKRIHIRRRSFVICRSSLKGRVNSGRMPFFLVLLLSSHGQIEIP